MAEDLSPLDNEFDADNRRDSCMYWSDSDGSMSPTNTTNVEFLVVVELFFQLPRLPLESNGRFDVSVLPTVFRMAAGLHECEVAAEDYLMDRRFSYKRVVSTPLEVNVRALWDAIASVEGWEQPDEGEFARHHLSASHDMTVHEWFNKMRPDLENFGSQQLLAQWQSDGGDVMPYAWPSCGLKPKRNLLHYHHRLYTTMPWIR